MRARRGALGLVAALALAPGSRPAAAVDAAEYLFVPVVTQGERELDLHMGVASAGSRTRHERNAGMGLGIGVTEHWFTEAAIEYHDLAGSGTTLDAVEWENIVQLAEPNEWPVDLGVVFIVEKPHASAAEPYEIPGDFSVRIGPLLQRDFGKIQANFNVLFVRHFQSRELPACQIRYQAQLKYRYSRPLEFGLQAFGNLGYGTQTWAAYQQQVHRIGPVVTGRVPLSGERSISYNAAFLAGTSARSPDRTLRMQVEYEF